VFYNNGTHRANIPTGLNSLTASDTTELGYTDRDNDDFNLTADAILRSTAIELP
jgi:hypothetical protein